MKTNPTCASTITEYLAAQLWKELFPGVACEIHLEKALEGAGPKDSQGLVYLAVKFLNGYTDATPGYSEHTTKDREVLYAKSPEQRRMDRKEGYGKLCSCRIGDYDGIWGDTNGASRKVWEGKTKLVYPNFHELPNYLELVAGSIFTGDYDLHGENIGVINGKKLARIDFGAAFLGNYWERNYFQTDIKPYTEDNPEGLFTNQLRNEHMHPKSQLLTHEFGERLEKIRKADVTGVLEEAWERVCKTFNKSTDSKMGDFYKGTRIPKKDWDHRREYTLQYLKNHFKARQESCGNLITEIRVYNEEDNKRLEEIVEQDLAYCKRLLREHNADEQLPQLGDKAMKDDIIRKVGNAVRVITKRRPTPKLFRHASAPVRSRFGSESSPASSLVALMDKIHAASQPAARAG